MMWDRRLFLSSCGGAISGVSPLFAQSESEKSNDALMTPEAERAVERGLSFLATTQADDGSFGDRQLYRGNVSVTSLAALAFMAGGHQPGRGRYGSNVLRALQFVLSKEQRQPAGFLHNPIGPQQLQMYSHGFGTLFLAEVYGMIPDRELQKRTRDTLERAVQLIIRAQNSEGGWRYQPFPQMADVSVTICQIMALRSARNAGLFVPKSTVDRCVKYVMECQTPDGGFSYFRQQGPSAFARSAAGVVALYCAGIYKGKEIDRGLKYLSDYHPTQGISRRDVPEMHYYYGQYYAAQAMWTAGGKFWENWFPAIRDELVARVRQRGDGVWTDVTTCNHYATAMACIILQISNNYLPILQK
ncbi:prenyltransferase/squalene oxidase repeat-containing protein [Tuwongella immobilis]|uniref:Prenyltransferase alpha-alpha toroid domain-containing protein n=1 Tax=Tuwongella immobilis TaxID=692036 RepID=A0A6C2YQ97_9BACT|nr:prenyltransferase/squalene oxidase repeat-containing protein [Tuwongella immobilis]VIP03293.1 prenyltransferase squalene oxidase : Prenyltransferase-like protein OS=uncultured bacterium PE=4 SV=1: Prenyltrans_1: Prenyltrans_1 [Tuwongella immobilis]VTS03957.1 prenyltransferase squalene oxidase : Prenyltransferase-like protein OS=uncultured bacterium PE=4 SV=1: Prenyltrans_1: Prenyltrans_1 [Tuwongella immobilis]